MDYQLIIGNNQDLVFKAIQDELGFFIFSINYEPWK